MPLALFPGAEVDPLMPERVEAVLDTRYLGRRVLYFPVLDTTMEVARKEARAGAPEGLLVLAEEQRAGRGRYSRRWEAPYGSSILASLLLRPAFLPPERAFLLTALAALAIAEAVEGISGLPCALKWPNDVLLEGRKVCGILVELEGTAAGLEWAVVGWGLNVNVDFRNSDLAGRAVSLAEAAGRPFPRLPLLAACLERMESRYEALRAGQEEIGSAWRARLSMLGRPVEVIAPEGRFSGLALDVAPDGALLVRRADGRVERVQAGDVMLRQEEHDVRHHAGPTL
ncbi:MAG: biotin--[acetyl-CoA-carboxylase] ligase [Chloroflexia bacterium]